MDFRCGKYFSCRPRPRKKRNKRRSRQNKTEEENKEQGYQWSSDVGNTSDKERRTRQRKEKTQNEEEEAQGEQEEEEEKTSEPGIHFDDSDRDIQQHVRMTNTEKEATPELGIPFDDIDSENQQHVMMTNTEQEANHRDLRREFEDDASSGKLRRPATPRCEISHRFRRISRPIAMTRAARIFENPSCGTDVTDSRSLCGRCVDVTGGAER